MSIYEFKEGNLEIIKGFNTKCYWVYSNRKDAYLDTPLSIYRYTEEDVINWLFDDKDNITDEDWIYEDIDL